VKLRKLNPELCRVELREVAKALFAWLYAHDRDWLEKHMPERRTKAQIRKSIWTDRDSELAAAAAVAFLKSQMDLDYSSV
jgi:hypothetical protein